MWGGGGKGPAELKCWNVMVAQKAQKAEAARTRTAGCATVSSSQPVRGTCLLLGSQLCEPPLPLRRLPRGGPGGLALLDSAFSVPFFLLLLICHPLPLLQTPGAGIEFSHAQH